MSAAAFSSGQRTRSKRGRFAAVNNEEEKEDTQKHEKKNKADRTTMFSRSRSSAAAKKPKTTDDKPAALAVTTTAGTTTAVSTAALPIVPEGLNKLRQELKEAEEAAKRWSKEVEDAYQDWKKENNKKKKDDKEKVLKEAKQERDRISGQVDELKAEIAAAETKLVDIPPSLEELLNLKLPLFEPRDLSQSCGLPVGPDAEVDMRFFPAIRPAAQLIQDELNTLSDAGQTKEMMLIAVSGAGKTSTIFQVARNVFTLYIPCTTVAVHDQLTRHARDRSGSFADLEAAVDRIGPSKANALEKTEEAIRLSQIFLVVHYFLLLLFLKRFPSASPLQFLLFQLTRTEGRNIARILFSRLQRLSVIAAGDLARMIREDLLPLLAASKSRVLLAIDEMEGAAKTDNRYISRNGHPGRGLLSPFLRAAGNLQLDTAVSILVCGTGSSQDRYDTVTSDIGKQQIKQILASGFPLATKNDVERVLLAIPGTTKEMIDALSNRRYLVNARYRLVARTVEIFMEERLDEHTDEIALIGRIQRSIEASVKLHKEKLMKSFNEQVNVPSMDEKSRRLKQIHAVYVASKLSNGRMDFTTSDLDLCRIGLGAMTEKNVFRVSEQFALEVIEEFFTLNPGLDASLWFEQSVTDLQTVIRARGTAVTAKGELFENVIFHAFRRRCFQDKPVTELGFVSTLANVEEEERKQKEWSSVIFKCNSVQALPIDVTDPRFVHENPYVMVSPQEYHRADGILYIPDSRITELGIKFYSSNVPSSVVESQFRATNPDKAYGHADVDLANKIHSKVRAEWDGFGFNRKKALRVHVNIPRSAMPSDRLSSTDCVYCPGTYLMEDDSIVVNIDMSNIRLLLGNPENEEEKRTFEAITRLLAVVNPPRY